MTKKIKIIIFCCLLIIKIKYFSVQNQSINWIEADNWKQAPMKAKRLNDPSAKARAKRSERAATSTTSSSSPSSGFTTAGGFMPL